LLYELGFVATGIAPKQAQGAGCRLLPRVLAVIPPDQVPIGRCAREQVKKIPQQTATCECMPPACCACADRCCTGVHAQQPPSLPCAPPSPRSRRYDSRTTIFSPEGRLYQVCAAHCACLPHARTVRLHACKRCETIPGPPSQVEYAMEAISNAGATMGALATDGVVLVAEKKITSKVGPASVLLLVCARCCCTATA